LTLLYEEVKPYGIPVTGIKTPPLDIYNEKEIFFSYNGWIMPKMGYIFAWWRKS
jgi:hypothetical protein